MNSWVGNLSKQLLVPSEKARNRTAQLPPKSGLLSPTQQGLPRNFHLVPSMLGILKAKIPKRHLGKRGAPILQS